MRTLQKTLFVIALVVLSTQTFRHVHVKYFAPAGSALDKYNEKVEKEIEQSKSIDELLAIYDTANEKVKEYEKHPDNPKIEHDERSTTEPYKTEYKARNAIETWEEHNNSISKLRFYWACGLGSILLGFFLYTRVDQWLGLVGIITGFSEMIFWTCPTIFGFFGARSEFERLLNNKLIFSLISWFALITMWFFLYKFPGKNKENV